MTKSKTEGNELKHNDTWIKVAKKIEKDGKIWKVNTHRQQPQHLLTVCTAGDVLFKI